MDIEITNIDRTEHDGDRANISISYLRDGVTTCVSAPESDKLMGTITDFICGRATAEETVLAAIGAGSASAVRETYAPIIEQLSENLTFDGNHVYYHGNAFDEIMLDEVLEDHLVRLIRAGNAERDLKAWIAFAERLYGNNCTHTRTHIVRWLVSQGWLTLDDKGRLVGYRGCMWDSTRNCPVSVHQGFAIVDGVHVNGHIPNKVGSIVEMPRSMVQHDPSHGCASGLHVGTYEYAHNWTGSVDVVVRVAVAPEDIVSVPTDDSSAKIRCCRFEVLDYKRKPSVETYYDDLTWEKDEVPDEVYDKMARDYEDREACDDFGDSLVW